MVRPRPLWLFSKYVVIVKSVVLAFPFWVFQNFIDLGQLNKSIMGVRRFIDIGVEF